MSQVVEDVWIHVCAIRPDDCLALRIDAYGSEQRAIREQRLEHRTAKVRREVYVAKGPVRESESNANAGEWLN
jgi:hypothetical protein